MSLIHELCQTIYDWPAISSLRESDWVYPLVETAHVLGIALMVGSIMAVDLRLLGWGFRDHPVERVTRALLPLTWVGFGLMCVTGLALFAAESLLLLDNPSFRLKMLLLVAAGVNAIAFHRVIGRSAPASSASPVASRVAGGVSMVLWLGVIVAGRLIAVFRPH